MGEPRKGRQGRPMHTGGRGGRKRLAGAWLALFAIAVIAAAAAGLGLYSKGHAAVAATRSPESSLITALAGTPVPATPSPAPTQTFATKPADAPEASPAPAEDPFFTNGEVLVDYGAMTYRSAGLYVKITNVSGNGQNYYVADCRMRDGGKLFTALAKETEKGKKRLRTSVIAQAKGAVIAINGDYFAARSVGIVIRNYKPYRKNPYYDIAAIYGDGTMKTYTKTQITAGKLLSDGAAQAFSFGPMMLDGSGKALKKFSKPPIWVTNPRTGIGYIEPNHFVLIVVDGRRPKGHETSGLRQALRGFGLQMRL
jgi:hypothetical protein